MLVGLCIFLFYGVLMQRGCFLALVVGDLHCFGVVGQILASTVVALGMAITIILVGE